MLTNSVNQPMVPLMTGKDLLTTAALPLAETITHATKGIKFTANTVSRAMDVANGGVKAHGGFHRLYGGHSFDFTMFKKFGFSHPFEMAKDSLTPNALPLPGVETAVRKFNLSSSAAQKWGTLNVGGMVAATLGGVDTIFNMRKFHVHKEKFKDTITSITIKGVVKVGVGTAHGNLPLIAFGVCDLATVVYSKIEGSIEFEFESSEFGMYPALN